MTKMFKMDDRSLKGLQHDLRKYASKVAPLVERDTVNNAAFKGQKRAKQIIRRRFIVRNTWTMRSVRVKKANTSNKSRIWARLGSTEDYLETQEFGKTIPKRGAKGVTIPTAIASGEAQGTKPRRRVVRRPNQMKAIRLLRVGTKAKSRKQFIVATIKAAAARGGARRFVYLPFNRHPGIYWITGGKKKARIRQIFDLSRKSITIPPTPWLLPASKRGQKSIPAFFVKSTKYHLHRAGLFK